MGDPSINNEVPVRCEARKDREQHRSSAPDDLREPPRRDETRRTVDLGHSSDGPSWIDLGAIRVDTTESRLEACLNRLLQQNRHSAGIGFPSSKFCCWRQRGRERALLEFRSSPQQSPQCGGRPACRHASASGIKTAGSISKVTENRWIEKVESISSKRRVSAVASS